MNIVKFKKLSELAVIPKFAKEGDAGMDLCSIENVVIPPKGWTLVKTGLAVELPEKTELQIRSRSGLALKNGIFVLNSPATIDEGYRGEIGIILANFSDIPFEVKIHDRVAQIVICQRYIFQTVESHELSETQRGETGFGSSGVGNN